MKGLRSTIGIYSFHKLKLQSFLKTPIRPGIIRSVNITLHPNNINRDSRIEIPEAWMPTIRQHTCNSQSLPQWTGERSVSSSDNANNTLDQNPPTMCEVRDTPITNDDGGTNTVKHVYNGDSWEMAR